MMNTNKQLSCFPADTSPVLIGDSMVKNIHGWKLGKKVGHRVVVKSFSGATWGDMEHYLKPTNTVPDHIVDLARKIENQSNAQVILSEVVSRSDDVPSESVKVVNKKLRKFCTQNGWRLVQHSNISNNGLNKSGLHLNARGNNIMFNNFVNCLGAHRSAWSSRLPTAPAQSSRGHPESTPLVSSISYSPLSKETILVANLMSLLGY